MQAVDTTPKSLREPVVAVNGRGTLELAAHVARVFEVRQPGFLIVDPGGDHVALRERLRAGPMYPAIDNRDERRIIGFERGKLGEEALRRVGIQLGACPTVASALVPSSRPGLSGVGGDTQRRGIRTPRSLSLSTGNRSLVVATLVGSNSTVRTSSSEPASARTSPQGSTTIE